MGGTGRKQKRSKKTAKNDNEDNLFYDHHFVDEKAQLFSHDSHSPRYYEDRHLPYYGHETLEWPTDWDSYRHSTLHNSDDNNRES